MSAPLPVLYSFRRCPYAMRARMALAVSGRACALREVVLKNKPDEMLAASPKGTVPILVLDDGTVIDESYEIMKWALGQNDPDGWLSPALGDIAEIDALAADLEETFKFHLDRYKYPNRYDDVDPMEHRAAGLAFLERLEARLGNSVFLWGDSFSLADAATAPFVRQFANTDRAWFDAQPIPKVQAWLDTILNADLFQSIMQKYPAWETGADEPMFP